MSDPRLETARVRGQEEIAPELYWMELELPSDYPEMQPGQYVNLQVAHPHAILFRRPFGVVEFRREADCSIVELFYAAVGEGTRAMTRWRSGDTVSCLGPLGTSYEVDANRPALLVAGGALGTGMIVLLHRWAHPGIDPASPE